MSTVAIALSVVVIVGGLVLVLLWSLIDHRAELESRPLTEQAQREREQDYLGVHAHPGMPPRDRIAWLGGDDTTGFWIWKEPPEERELNRGTDHVRRFHRQ